MTQFSPSRKELAVHICGYIPKKYQPMAFMEISGKNPYTSTKGGNTVPYIWKIVLERLKNYATTNESRLQTS